MQREIDAIYEHNTTNLDARGLIKIWQISNDPRHGRASLLQSSATEPATDRWKTSPPISPACRTPDTPQSGGGC